MSDRIVYAVGAAVIVEWELVAAQVRQTGLAGSTTARVFDEANTLFSTPSITELSLGGSTRAVYQVSFTPDAAGQWHVTIDETTGPFAISESYEVVAAADVDSARLVAIQADTDNIQTRLPGSLTSGGRMRSQVEVIDAGVITAAATDATFVTEVQGAADAALVGRRLDELIDQVASPVTPTIDSFIDRMTSKDGTQAYDRSTDSLEAVRDALAAAGPSAAVIAGAVWDKLRAGHVAAGSFGEGVASVQGNVTGSVASVTGNVVGSIGSVALNGITSASLDPSAGTEIGAAVDVTLTGSHGAGAWGGGGGLSAQQVRDSMLLAPTAGAPAAGSVDAHLDTIEGRVDVATSTRSSHSAADVNTTLTGAHGAGSWVDSGAPPSVVAIVNGVLDEALAGHLTAGTAGRALSDAAAGGAGMTPQQVADALNLAPAGVAAAGSVNWNLDEIMGPGFDPLTDSLEAIRDQVDVCCGAGGSSGDVVDFEGA